MASTAKVLSPSSFEAPPRTVELRAVPAPAPRPDRWGGLRSFRDSYGGALVIAASIALWAATWAAVAGPLSPVGDAPAAVVQETAR